jgi:hypothetical protein
MPPAAVPRTVQDFILYYYAKLVIAPAAGFARNYGFIMDIYQRLRCGAMSLSQYDREIERAARQTGRCVFCDARGETVPVAVIPSHLGGPVGVHNLVQACSSCAASKGDKDLFVWWCDELGRDKDEMPRIPAGLFLKLAYEKHTVEFGLGRPCQDIRQIWTGTPETPARARGQAQAR